MIAAQRAQVLRPQARPLAAPRPLRRMPVVKVKASAAAVVLAPEYGYVVAATAVVAAVTQWQAIRVALARKKYGVAYPQMYAEGRSEEAVVFNCIQRAHQNTLEYAPAMTILGCMLGLRYPIVAAAALAIWSLGRIVYTLGYSTGDPTKRVPGAALSSLAYLGTIVATFVVGARVALAL